MKAQPTFRLADTDIKVISISVPLDYSQMQTNISNTSEINVNN